MANTATLTSPDGVFTITITVPNAEAIDGAYPVQLSGATPTGQQVAVEWNGTRIYEDVASAGTGTEG